VTPHFFHRGKKSQAYFPTIFFSFLKIASSSPSFSFHPPSLLITLTMLSSRLTQATRSVSRHSLTFKKATVLRSYHVFHEEQANVLPNKVETASASFKVSELQ
jgi:hypothetical protein